MAKKSKNVKILSLLLVFAMAFALTACGGGDKGKTENTAAATDNSQNIKVNIRNDDGSMGNPIELNNLDTSESGWQVSGGNCYFAVKVNNPNKEYAVMDTKVDVNGVDKDGKVLFSDSVTRSIYPGDGNYVTAVASCENPENLDRLEITYNAESSWAKKTDATTDEMYVCKDVKVENVNNSNLQIEGKVDVNADYTPDVSNLMISIVFYNKDGSMAGGAVGEVEPALKEGNTYPFHATTDVLKYDSVKAFGSNSQYQ